MKQFNTASSALAAKAAAALASRKTWTAARPADSPAAALATLAPSPAPVPLEALQAEEVVPTHALAQSAGPAASAQAPASPRSVRLPRGKISKIATVGGKVQFNILLGAEPREKLRRVAFAEGTTERELVERFISQLPEIALPQFAVPPGMKWLVEPR